MKIFNYNKLFLLFLFFFPCILLGKSSYRCEQLYYSEFSLKHREHRGVGFNQGYSTFAAFVAPPKSHLFSPFFDARLHSFNSGYIASNLGFGMRFTNPSRNVIAGAHIYYDYRNYKSFSSHQGSLGVELLTRWVDLRGSVNAPFSGLFKDSGFHFDKFQGNHSIFKRTIRYALPTAEAEVGITFPPPLADIHLHLAFGGYYLFKQNGETTQTKSAVGGKVRLTASPKEYIQFDVQYTKDQLFGSRTNGSICFNIPLGKQKIKSKKYSYSKYDETCSPMPGIAKRYAETPFHQEIIPFYTENAYARHSTPDNIPYKFIFVNNTNLAPSGVGSGDGTFENPYTTLKLAEERSTSNDIIYVFYGRGNDDGYDEGFIFKNNQILQGSGTPLTINGHTYAPFTPGFLPIISNSGAISTPCIQSISSLNPFIQGFRLEATNADIISLSSCNIACLQNIFYADPSFYAIDHTAPLGTSLVANNTLYDSGCYVAGGSLGSTYTFDQNTFVMSNENTGVFISEAPIASFVSDNLFSSSASLGAAIYLEYLSSVPLNSTIVNNSAVSGFEYAVSVQDQSSSSSITIQNNSFSGTYAGAAINVQCYSYSSNYTINNNTLNSASNSTIAFAYLPIDALTYFSKNSLSIYENTINYNGTYNGVYIDLGESAQLECSIVDNQFHLTSAGVAGKGISITNHSTEPTCLEMIYNSGVYGLTLAKASSGALQVQAIGSSLTGLCSQNNNIPLANCVTSGSILYVPPGSPCPPFQAIFVNNTANPALGNGSYVYPFAALSQAEAASSSGDMIYIFTGNGTSSGYNQGISLKENQLLVGSSTPFSYKGITMDPLTTGAKPKISLTSTGSGSTIKTPCSTRIIGLEVSSVSADQTLWVTNSILGPSSGSLEQCDLYSSSSSYCLSIGDSNFNKTFSVIDSTFLTDTISAISYTGNNNHFDFQLINSVIYPPSGSTTSPAIAFDIGDVGNTLTLTNNTISYPNTILSLQDASVGTSVTITLENNDLTSTASLPGGTPTINCSASFSGSDLTLSLLNNSFHGYINDVSLSSSSQSKLTLGNNLFVNNLKVMAKSICFPSFTANQANVYDFNGYTGQNSTYTFTQTQPYIQISNTGTITFTPSSGHTVSEVYSTPCP